MYLTWSFTTTDCKWISNIRFYLLLIHIHVLSAVTCDSHRVFMHRRHNVQLNYIISRSASINNAFPCMFLFLIYYSESSFVKFVVIMDDVCGWSLYNLLCLGKLTCLVFLLGWHCQHVYLCCFEVNTACFVLQDKFLVLFKERSFFLKYYC